MPSQTFINLCEEKKQRIYNAIYAELRRVPFPEMSINRIIKTAGIPRGSFYQYFENKDDAFEYFVSECSVRIKECVIKRISTVHGDLFELSQTVFDEIVKAGAEHYKFDLINNVIPYVDLKKLIPFSKYIEKMEEEQRIQAYSSLGIGNLNIKSEEEFMDIIGIIEALFQSALPQIFFGTDSGKNLSESFKRKLDIIKRATVKEEI